MRTRPKLKYWVIAFIGILISFSIFYQINDKKVQKNKILVDNAISKAELKINDELQKIHLVIESMAYFFELNQEVSPSTFQRFTSPFKEGLNGIKALEWAPKLLGSEKTKFALGNSEGFAASIKEANDSYNLVQSQPKAIYYPISLINPPEHKWILGYDLYSEIHRQTAIKQSTASKKMALTAPIQLVNDDNRPAFLAFKTVFEPDGITEKGVVAVVYRMDHFLENTLSNELDILDITVRDKEAGNALLYSSLGSDKIAQKPGKQVQFNAANRLWVLSYHPKGAYNDFPHTPESYFVLLLGFVTTALLLTNLLARDNRSDILETKVSQRTQELEISNRQKENLLREIHHRVMNNLQITSSLINLQKRKLQDEEAIWALTSSQDRINAIALIHQKIYQHDGADAVDLRGYLENLIKSHKRISPNVKYTIDCPKLFIDLDTAVPLAIITSEIVINALKHAFVAEKDSNMLYILVTPSKNDVIEIVISDNGIGFPKDLDINKSKGLGYDIIKKLCRQLEGDYEYASSANGTAFSLKFKQRRLQMPVFA